MDKAKVYRKKIAPNCYLYLMMPKKMWKFAPSQGFHPQSDYIINTHTQNTLPCICHRTTSISVYRAKLPKNKHFGFQKTFDTPPKTEPNFRKLNSPLTKLGMLFPLTSSPGCYVHKLHSLVSKPEEEEEEKEKGPGFLHTQWNSTASAYYRYTFICSWHQILNITLFVDLS